MAKKSSWNPIAFVPAQVTIISSAVYIALFAVLIWVHSSVPAAPSDPTPIKGLNLSQAWLDLDFITDGYHPMDSRRNAVVREYLLHRIEQVLEGNGVGYKVVGEGNGSVGVGGEEKAVTVFARDSSNSTFADAWRGQPWTCYGESENVMVYIRGKRDVAGEWWEDGGEYEGPSGVLVNAHYDSVASGYGATDDGVGVATVLQLISYFTSRDQQPERGIVVLLNNGEEAGLFGAQYFTQHPLARFTHTFLNLEGAGAGGRAALFRSTDAEVTAFYSKSPSPFGTAISGDGFKQRLIRSNTDYSVFVDGLGMRGLDVAFYEPRAKYHTSQDDVKNTSPNSLWHMLSASLETVKGLTSYSGDEFEGSEGRDGRLKLAKGSTGVWFDVFGQAFAVCRLNTLFALSVVLLVAPPVILLLLEIILAKSDKWYPFARKRYLHSSDDDDPVHLDGFRGFFRFPVAFVVATAAVLALAYLVTKINPEIAYSSQYAVWAMMLTAFFAVAWFFLAGADRVRPSALQRMYCLIWIYVISWVGLVAATVGENNFRLASGYFVVIYNAAAFVALLISYFELLALPTKQKYVEHIAGAVTEHEGTSTRHGRPSSRSLLSRSRERAGASTAAAEDDDRATENTSLLRGEDRRNQNTFTGFGKRRQDQEIADESDDPFLAKAYGDEQAWSSSLPQWTWILQFIILAPINIIIIGQIALLLTSALHQTPADGNSVLLIYLSIAAFTVLLLLPLTPFLHRFTYPIPTLLFLVFVGCLIYNLLAFPFSREAQMKHFFVQSIDLDAGTNNVTLTGLDGYLQEIIAELPSAAGQALQCGAHLSGWPIKDGLQSCSWHGLAPNVVPKQYSAAKGRNASDGANPYQNWLDYNITASNSSATFTFRGQNTKQCRLLFDHPVSDVRIADAATDARFPVVGEDGSRQVRLFSRTWDKRFTVTVAWPDHQVKGQTGKVMCTWNDANRPGTIPAYDEIVRFEPAWSVVTKGNDGLVEGWKGFEI